MFKTRLMTAAVLVAGFLVGLFSLSDMAWALLLFGIILHGAWGWGGLSGFKLRQQVFYVLLMLFVGLCLLPGTGWQIFTEIQYHIRFWTILASTAFWLLLVPLAFVQAYREAKMAAGDHRHAGPVVCLVCSNIVEGNKSMDGAGRYGDRLDCR